MKLKYKTDFVPESRSSVFDVYVWVYYASNMFFDAHYVLT